MLKVDNHIPMQNFVPFSFYHRVVKAEKIVSLYFSESICINDADPHTQVHSHVPTAQQSWSKKCPISAKQFQQSEITVQL